MEQRGIHVIVERQVAQELSLDTKVFTIDGDGGLVCIWAPMNL